MVHVLPDANEMMAAAAPGFPWAFAFALFGVLLNVAVNQVCVFEGGRAPVSHESPLSHTPIPLSPTPKSHNSIQGMEIAFRRIYGVPFDSQEQHNHDQAEARQEEGRGLLPSTTSSTNGAAFTFHCPSNRHLPS